MDHKAKADFVLAMTKHGLKAMDSGGLIADVGNALTVTNPYSATSPTSSNTVGAQQATLAGELGTEAAGGGPNPAQLQLQQNAQNIAQGQAVTNANNRALNPGLAARMSGNVAANANATAVSNSGIQQAQQQLAAQQQMEGLTGQEQQGVEGADAINAQVAQNNANASNATSGGLISGVGSALTAVAGLAKGGLVKKMASGGSIIVPGSPNLSNASVLSSSGSNATKIGSSIGKFLNGQLKGSSDVPGFTDPTFGQSAPGGSTVAPNLGISGASPAPAAGPSLGVGTYAKGGKINLDPSLLVQAPGMADLMTKGGKVKAGTPAQKATVKGNSLKNDKIPTLLSENEEVLPRSVMQSKDPVKAAAAFVRAEMAKKGLRAMHGLSRVGKAA